MKTILAATWNALIDRLRREQILGCTVVEHVGWKHPWQVTPSWSFEREEWVAQIHPGFVNGLDAEVRIAAGEAPPETLERLGASNEERVDARLTEGPRTRTGGWWSEEIARRRRTSQMDSTRCSHFGWPHLIQRSFGRITHEPRSLASSHSQC
jgi:hypothetical protein